MDEVPNRYSKFQFSLGFLLLAVTQSAAATHLFSVPRQVATQFAASINTGDFSKAESLCVEHSAGLFRRWLGDNFDHAEPDPTAIVMQSTWPQFGRRQREVWVGRRDGGSVPGPTLNCVATRNGVEIADRRRSSSAC